MLNVNCHLKKNLIFLLPNFSQGGAGFSILKLCKSIDYKNNNIYIISLGKNYYKKEFKQLNINVIELSKKKLVFAISNIKKILLDIYNFNKKEIYLITNINYANALICFFFAKIEFLKIITIERTPVQELDFNFSFLNFFKNKVIKLLIKFFYKNAYLRIGNSIQVSRDLEKLCRCQVKTILPFISIKKNKIKIFKKKNIYLTWIGRLSPEKNINDLLSAIEYLDKINFKLNIVTNKKINLKQFNIKKNLQKNIYINKFNNINLNNLYNETDILISTSFYEGFPNVIAEAINYNCFIISAKNFGGSNQLLSNGKYGYNYTVSDPKDLSRKIIQAIKNKKIIKKKIISSKKKFDKAF